MYHLIISQENCKKKQRKLDDVKAVFDASGKDYEVHVTASKQDVKDITAALTSDSGNDVIVLGGDGTLHDVLNSFVDFENNALGLIPFGTGNDFAGAVRVPNDAKKAAELIIGSSPEPVDFIEFESGLRSLNAFGMGIDVDVLEHTYSGKNKKRSKYLHALIVSLIKFKSHNFTVRYNGREERHFGLIAAVGNGKQFGGGIKMFPDATPDDGYLDLIIVDFISKIKMIGAFLKLMRGKVNSLKQATVVKVKEVEFIPDESDFLFQADGELYENIPMKAKIVTGKLKFFTAI
ncbi:MAG: YegS/Rv2252/BmrU family lipid kinase [Roseburia sp.]|nr:YegS/Rv2252/BmrU family lipid kinase [Roseburia sp.]